MKLVKIIDKMKNIILFMIHLCSKVLICCFTVGFQKDLRDDTLIFISNFDIFIS